MKQGDYRLGYRSDIEGLRAIAILLVLGAHAGVPWLAGGFVGVDVFFVLSGFLITGLLLHEMHSTGRIAFSDFYLRRFRRLMPALVLMITVTSLAAGWVLPPGEQLQQPSAAAMAALWMSNVYFVLARLDYFAAGTDSNLFLHTWSLGVEEQFYVVWPLLLFALVRGAVIARTRRIKVVLGLTAVVGVAASILLTPRYPQFAFYMMPVRAWEFALGGLIWLGVHRHQGVESQKKWGWAYWAGWLGLVMIIGTAATYSANMAYPGWRAVLPVVGAVAVVMSGTRGEMTHGVSWLLSWTPLQALGRISYAWYLWHWPVLLLGQSAAGSNSPWCRLLCVMVSLGLAWLSYRFVEYPIRHQSFWLRHRRAALMAGLGLAVAINLQTMHWFESATAAMSSPALQRFERARTDAPIIYAEGCDDWYYSDKVRACGFGTADAPHTAVLMGDSIAGQWFPAVEELFNRPGWRLIVLTKSSCPMVDVPFFYARIGREYTECSVWRSHALEQVASLRPDIVLLGTVATNDFSQAQWTQGTSRVLGRLSAAVDKVAILRGTPHLPFDGPTCLSARQQRPGWLPGRAACEAPAFDARDQLVFRWLEEASAGFANARVIDMNDLVCPQGICSAEQGTKIVFRDSQHMTASFAKTLAPALAQRLGIPSNVASSPDAGASLRRPGS